MRTVLRVTDILIIAAFFIITGIIPLVVRATSQPTPPEVWDLIIYKSRIDTFAYWKSVLLISSAIVILLCFIIRLFIKKTDEIKRKAFFMAPPVIAAAVYMLFLTISDISSPYRHTAFLGTVGRFEGFFAQMAYIIIFIAAMYYAHERIFFRTILIGLIFSSLIMGAIGVSQFMRNDFFSTDLGNILVAGAPGRLLSTSGFTYGTLFNSNAFGLYTAMLAPFLLLLGFVCEGSGLINILLLAAGALMAAGTPGSRSFGGLFGIIAACSIIVIVYAVNHIYHKKRPHWSIIMNVVILITIEVLAYMFIPPGGTDTVARDFQNEIGIMTSLEDEEGSTDDTSVIDYIFNEGALHIIKGSTTFFSLTAAQDNWLTVKDGKGLEVKAYSEESSNNGLRVVYRYDISDYGQITITRRTDEFNNEFYFNHFNLAVLDGKIIPLTQNGFPIDIEKSIPSIGFKGYERIASGRGYIWSRSIPLLLKHPVTGSGSDTFINVFPQDDVLNKRRFLYEPYIIIDKAHNLYLQTGITTGGISMIALIFVIGYYIITTFLSLIKSKEESPARFGLRLAILAAVCAYAVSSLATDSTIATTGVFVVILGIGYALNYPHKHILF